MEKQGDKTQQISSSLKDRETYSIAKPTGVELLGFQAGEDEFVREERPARGSRGSRGGRGGARGAPRGSARGGARAAGGQLRVDAEEYPSLA